MKKILCIVALMTTIFTACFEIPQIVVELSNGQLSAVNFSTPSVSSAGTYTVEKSVSVATLDSAIAAKLPTYNASSLVGFSINGFNLQLADNQTFAPITHAKLTVNALIVFDKDVSNTTSNYAVTGLNADLQTLIVAARANNTPLNYKLTITTNAAVSALQVKATPSATVTIQP